MVERYGREGGGAMDPMSINGFWCVLVLGHPPLASFVLLCPLPLSKMKLRPIFHFLSLTTDKNNVVLGIFFFQKKLIA